MIKLKWDSYSSIDEMVEVVFPFLAIPFMIPGLKEMMIKLKWDSYSRIKTSPFPYLFLSGSKDAIVPRVHMEKLYKAVPHNKKSEFVIEGADHNNTWLLGKERYWIKIRKFISDYGR